MLSRYHADVDPDTPNDARSLALGMVGWNKRVLELGAASGHVTRVLVERHCDVTAVEYEAEVAEELEGLASEVIVGNLDDEHLLDGLPADFDVVLAGDLLEHLVDPGRVLRRAARLLVPGGRVVVSLPNVAHADLRMSLLQGTWDYKPWGLLDRTHLRFFTLHGVEKMVEEAGLVITEMRRVRLPAFESELAVPRDSVPTAVINHILADPEAETYQFVFTAIREGHDDQLRRLAGEKLSMEVQLDWEKIAHAATEAEVAAQRQRVAEREQRAAEREQEVAAVVDDLQRGRAEENAQYRTQIEATMAERDSALRDVEAARLGLRRVEESVTWQSFQRARGAVVRGGGGERSRPVRLVQAGLRGFGRVALKGRR